MSIQAYNWILLNKRAYEDKYMCPLFDFILKFFIEIFGEEIMFSEPCVVYNDPSEDVPMLIINYDPIKIRTTVKSLKINNNWEQFIYQLSHELTHYAIRQQKKNKNTFINWFEETICEAMSLYILHLSSNRWLECVLSIIKPEESLLLLNYLNQVLNTTKESVLKKCLSLSDLQYIECNYGFDRDERSLERNYLYNTFISMPDDIKTIIYYTQYIQLNGLQIDFTSWKTENKKSEDFISRLGLIQPSISA